MAGAATAVLAVALLLRLALQARWTWLFSDECFHAYLARWIAVHHRLPERLTEFYGGLWYSYPPLFHLLGAAWVSAFGAGNLVGLNLLLFATLLTAIAFVRVPGVTAAPRRWAILLCIANGWFATYAVRFFAEMLICLLTFVAVVALLRHHHRGRMLDALLAGLALGLALLAKQTAIVLLGLVACLVVAALIARRPARVGGLLVAGIAGLALALPHFIRNTQLYGSPIYPALAHDTDRELYALYRQQAGYSLASYVAGCLRTIGPAGLLLGAIALTVAAIRRRWDITVGLLGLCLTGIAFGWLSPLHDARHVAPLVAVMTLLSAIIVHRAVEGRPRLAQAVEGTLLLVAALAVARLPEVRRPLNVPLRLHEAYEAARAHVPEGRTILSLWTYDTFYYTGRPATWPLAWGQRVHPVEIFSERDPGRFLALLRRDRIEYLLVPRAPAPEQFLGSNYSRSFQDCVVRLIGDGRLRVLWTSPAYGLVAVAP